MPTRIDARQPLGRNADFVIALLRAGGGTRVKIIEAAHGCPVVATSFAVEGTTFQHEVGMLVADGEMNFLRGCLLLARGGSFPAHLATRARAKVRRDYSPAYWRERLADLVCGLDAG